MGDAFMWKDVPEVEIASNRFVNVPIVIQVEDTPLLEFVRSAPAGYRAHFPIYHSDGTKIAVVKGARIFLTDEGKKGKVRVVHEPELLACELEGKQFLELRKSGASALRGFAELYAPQGHLIRATDADVFTKLHGTSELTVAGMTLRDNTITGFRIGLLVRGTTVAVGVN